MLFAKVAASPAGPPSVPTPSTLGSIQSPASIYNPGSVGPSVTSPAPMNPADEQAYLEKVFHFSLILFNSDSIILCFEYKVVYQQRKCSQTLLEKRDS